MFHKTTCEALRTDFREPALVVQFVKPAQDDDEPVGRDGRISIRIASGSAPQRHGIPTQPSPRETISIDERNE
jgi:hypothetical protein